MHADRRDAEDGGERDRKMPTATRAAWPHRHLAERLGLLVGDERGGRADTAENQVVLAQMDDYALKRPERRVAMDVLTNVFANVVVRKHR
ncbi:hypothetical protein SAMN04489725_10331 [Alicyclobacillus hesperidum]|uniref:Uncharacterized protein n=1 Tax=Alicyclobacillus hesperidum TaxID=89784 RepID=A0A1H2RK08_9BACL|nr:hypothetical protein SAMN04489725_10331 [Alicyclobacillus hesperidum]